MKTLLMLTVLYSLSAAAEPRTCEESHGLQGRWRIASMPEGWKRVPGIHIVVTDDQIQVRCGAVVTCQMLYTVNTSRRTIDATKMDARKPTVQRGIYRLANDTITISVAAEGKPRPRTADSTDGGAMRWTLQRVSGN